MQKLKFVNLTFLEWTHINDLLSEQSDELLAALNELPEDVNDDTEWQKHDQDYWIDCLINSRNQLDSRWLPHQLLLCVCVCGGVPWAVGHGSQIELTLRVNQLQLYIQCLLSATFIFPSMVNYVTDTQTHRQKHSIHFVSSSSFF